MIELLELKFSRRWQTNKIESDWSNLSRHSFSRQFRSPGRVLYWNFFGFAATIGSFFIEHLPVKHHLLPNLNIML